MWNKQRVRLCSICEMKSHNKLQIDSSFESIVFGLPFLSVMIYHLSPFDVLFCVELTFRMHIFVDLSALSIVYAVCIVLMDWIVQL